MLRNIKQKFLNSSALQFISISVVIIFCGLYFRSYPVTHNLDKPNRLAYKHLAYLNLRNNIESRLKDAYPTMPPEVRSKVAAMQFKKMANSESINIETMATDIKESSTNDLFNFYLLGADSYYYYYLTKKILDSGAVSSIIKGGKYFEPLMMAPGGHWRILEIHPYIGAYFYKALSLFTRRISLMMALSLIPLFLYSLVVIVFVGVCRRMELNKVAILISGIFLSLSPIFIQRSSIGWYDTDPYNVLFLLSAIMLLFSISPEKRSFLQLSALAFLSGLYALIWQGWLFMPVIILIIFLITAFTRNMRRISLPKRFKLSAIYLIGTTFFAVLFLTPKGFINSIIDILDIFKGFLLLNSNLWPDIFLTVGELSTPTISKIHDTLGGVILLPLAGFGLISLFVRRNKNQHLIIGTYAVCIFSLLSLIMSKNAQRFIIFLLPMASICFAVALDKIISASHTFFSNILKAKRYVVNSIILCIFLPLLSLPVIYGHSSALAQNSMFNVVWKDSLEFIKDNTPPDSIINCWWPPGHFIKAIANRKVTFDGATMNTPQAYWTAGYLLSTDEKEAVGILRMLNSSGNKATELLLENFIPLDKAVDLIKRSVIKNKNDAKEFLLKYLSLEIVEKLIPLTHGEPPPSYCYIYDEMAEDVLGLCYVSKWDFTKAIKLENERYARLKKGDIFWRGSKSNISLVWDIAGGKTYIGIELTQKSKTGEVVSFANGVMFNEKQIKVWIDNLENKVSGIPQDVFLMDSKGNVTHKEAKTASIKLSVLIRQNEQGIYSCIVAPRYVLSSVLFRLYYLNGWNLRSFEKVREFFNPLLRKRILVYKVKWE